MNNVSIIGRLTKDVEIKKTQSNKSVALFAIAVDNNVKKGEEKSASFFNCVAWENTAEVLSKYTRKGDKIAISGSLTQRSYTNNNNQLVNVVEINVNSITLIENRSEKKTETKQEGSPTEQVFEDDLPF